MSYSDNGIQDEVENLEEEVVEEEVEEEQIRYIV